jgi:large exoprotein involved in heme utilization and adhesion
MKVKNLEARIAQLENTVKSSNQTLVLQVGTSKITITATDIKLESKGRIEILPTTDLVVRAGTNIDARASNNIIHRASGSMQVEASGVLTLKGSSINQN